MEKQPSFLRDFSRQESPEKRRAVAQQIKDVRRDYFDRKKKAELQQVELQATVNEKETLLTALTSKIEETRQKLATINERPFWQRWLDYRNQRLQQSRLNEQNTTHNKTNQELKQLRETLGLTHVPSRETDPITQEVSTILTSFYEQQKAAWQEADYSQEDIERYFTEDYLRSLPLEDYTLLLKRFPSEMVTHVTRQGIRDHAGWMYHSGGIGAYANTFVDIMKSKRLLSPLGTFLAETERRQAIANLLRLDQYETEEAARNSAVTINRLSNANIGGKGSYADLSSVHFAAEEVADEYYGAERGNEIFFAFPSAMIASQYRHFGKLIEGGDGKHNDLWVWGQEQSGMSTDAGIVFLPATTPVCPRTGSRYELDEQLNPSVNEELKSELIAAVQHPDFVALAESALPMLVDVSRYWSEERTANEARLQAYQQQLRDKLGIQSPEAIAILSNYSSLNSLFYTHKQRPDFRGFDTRFEDTVVAAMQSQALYYTPAKAPIPAQELWERFFAERPHLKPSKIVYYSEASPTEALHEWRRREGLEKKAKSPDMGFTNHAITPGSPQANIGFERFQTLADEVIRDYFKE